MGMRCTMLFDDEARFQNQVPMRLVCPDRTLTFGCLLVHAYSYVRELPRE